MPTPKSQIWNLGRYRFFLPVYLRETQDRERSKRPEVASQLGYEG